MSSGLHISIEAEPIIHLAGLPISNSLAVTLFVSLLLIIMAFWFNKESKKKNPSSLFVLLYNLFSGLYSFFEQVAGEKTMQFFPLLGTLFLFIILCNWIGLLPGFGSIGIKEAEDKFIPILRGPTADLNTTLVLALISVFSIQYFGIKSLGFSHYIKKFINLKNPIDFVVGLLEIVSEVSKIISFSSSLWQYFCW